ncbi:MAG TPA: VOC family protein [Chloroflexota bacterium]
MALAAALREIAANEPAAVPEEEVIGDEVPRPADEHALGKRQRQIVEVPGLASLEGMKTADVAAAIGYDVPNTYVALQVLTRYQVVEQVPNKEPQHWRLVRRYRAGARVFARLAGYVQAGEWTTAGDLSIAARGDLRAAEAIARAGLSDRVVAEPAGVAAEMGQRVGWDELARRAAKAEERRRSMTRAQLNYVQIPALDLDESITFYEEVLGWKVNRHPTVGAVVDQSAYPEFSDSTGQAGGAFVLGRVPSREPGIMPCIAVDSIAPVLEAVTQFGGEVVKPRTAIVEGTDWEATFRDPAGNAIGLYEQAAP